MKIIGLTGGVGSGKSTIAKLIAQNFNACVIIADEVGHLCMEKGQPCYRDIITEFGVEIMTAEEKIDRAKLAEIVFQNAELLKNLNAIIHPRVREYIEAQIAQVQSEGKADYIFIESAILLEAGYENICDEFWFVSVSDEIRRKRLKESRGYSDEKITHILQNQKNDSYFKTKCNVILDNNGESEKMLSVLKVLLV
ncbi:dephospho-CoA kinase [Anaeromicropila populeti]|uniref:Dephospho-CoA kinase n=1 Tax=Anaeromicropila populeti TaxID=37658 RepID=A0A1I6KXT8_9FIRM|nr:dephospho-CoA kinase [Anaeromicropila populeti]SFR96032.1 dephospho-CoA kinase [Anaeromicropila populeti]